MRGSRSVGDSCTNALSMLDLEPMLEAPRVAGMVHHLELSAAIDRAFVFVAREEHEGPVSALELPEKARVTHLYRDGELHLADPDTRVAKGDQVVVVTHARHLDALRESI